MRCSLWKLLLCALMHRVRCSELSWRQCALVLYMGFGSSHPFKPSSPWLISLRCQGPSYASYFSLALNEEHIPLQKLTSWQHVPSTLFISRTIPFCTCQLGLNFTNSLDYITLLSAEYMQFQLLEIIFNNLQGIWWNLPGYSFRKHAFGLTLP